MLCFVVLWLRPGGHALSPLRTLLLGVFFLGVSLVDLYVTDFAKHLLNFVDPMIDLPLQALLGEPFGPGGLRGQTLPGCSARGVTGTM